MIVGDPDDSHVDAVVRHMKGAVVVDASSLADGGFAVVDDGPMVLTTNGWTRLAPRSGWLRRLAPAGWTCGVQAHSREAADRAAWLAMLVALVRTSGAQWLTGIDALLAGESKIVQAAEARSLGIPVPRTVLASGPRTAVQLLQSDDLVVKALGPSSFLLDSSYVSLPTTAISAVANEAFLPEAFQFQQRVIARRHLRIVTVADDCWIFERTPDVDEPVDWRSSSVAHAQFQLAESSEQAERALAVARSMALGYSSQDWIDDGEICWLVDVNPAGQWLFLEHGSSQIAAAIAFWLETSFE